MTFFVVYTYAIIYRVNLRMIVPSDFILPRKIFDRQKKIRKKQQKTLVPALAKY